ncbi:MAG: hypothetical protein ACI9AR_000174 [Flavobacteriaceae bacterium]|jgi:hypothetical protein
MKKYRHYKNQKTYTLLHEAWDTERKEKVVVYRGEYSCAELGKNPIFTRNKDEFFSSVINSEGEEVLRFESL